MVHPFFTASKKRNVCRPTLPPLASLSSDKLLLLLRHSSAHHHRLSDWSSLFVCLFLSSFVFFWHLRGGKKRQRIKVVKFSILIPSGGNGVLLHFDVNRLLHFAETYAVSVVLL